MMEDLLSGESLLAIFALLQVAVEHSEWTFHNGQLAGGFLRCS